MSRLAGKVVVVTGTSPNIGGGIAEGLADEGARVVCVDIDADDAGQCAESIVRIHPGTHVAPSSRRWWRGRARHTAASTCS